MHTKVSAGLADVVEMAKCRNTLKEQIRESDWEFLRTLREKQVTSGAVLEA